jgi:hypothetical protein
MNNYLSFKTTILIAIFALLVSACSKKNNPAPPVKPTVSIVGKWYITIDSDNYYTYGTNALEGQFINSYNRSAYTQFNSDNTGIMGMPDTNNIIETFTFTYTVGASGAITYNIPAQTTGGVAYAAGGYSDTIKKLTSTNLLLYYNSINLHPGNARYAKELTYFSR